MIPEPPRQPDGFRGDYLMQKDSLLFAVGQGPRDRREGCQSPLWCCGAAWCPPDSDRRARAGSRTASQNKPILPEAASRVFSSLLLANESQSATTDCTIADAICLRYTSFSCHDFDDNKVRLHLFVLAYNLGNFLRQLVLPREIKRWTLTTTREKLIKIGAKIVRHARRVAFQLAEVAVPRRLFLAILCAINRLRLPMPAPG